MIIIFRNRRLINFSKECSKNLQGMTKNFHKVTEKFSPNFDKNNKIDCLFSFEIIKKN